jgi:methionyl aminopeptidase
MNDLMRSSKARAPQRLPVLKTPEEISIMREAGRITARAHQAMREALRPGITTLELDKIAETVIRDHGAVPCFLGYAPGNHRPYPATINASINDELVHGVPSAERVVKEGDIISLDTACSVSGDSWAMPPSPTLWAR